MNKTISINIESDLYDKLKSRAKKQMQTLSELTEDIIRRSMLSYKRQPANNKKADDSLIPLFSRMRRSRKK